MKVNYFYYVVLVGIVYLWQIYYLHNLIPLLAYTILYSLFVLTFLERKIKYSTVLNILTYFVIVIYWMIFHPRYLYGNPFFLFSSIVAIISGILIIKDEEKKGLGLLSLGIIINVIIATDKNYMRISFLDPIFLTISFITWRIGNKRPKLQTSDDSGLHCDFYLFL